MAELQIRRRTSDVGYFRRMLIEVDGSVVASLRPDQEQIVTVNAGRHVLRARMDWTASRPLEVHLTADERVEFESGMPARAMFDMIVRPGSALTLQRIS